MFVCARGGVCTAKPGKERGGALRLAGCVCVCVRARAQTLNEECRRERKKAVDLALACQRAAADMPAKEKLLVRRCRVRGATRDSDMGL